MTRAVCHAVHGHWAQSVAWHPAGLILAAGLLGWMLWAAAEAWRGQPIAEALRRRLAKALIIAGVAVSGVFWIAQLTQDLTGRRPAASRGASREAAVVPRRCSGRP